MISFSKYAKWYFIVAGIITIACLAFLIYFGLNLGIDFTGGSILRLEYTTARPDIKDISSQLTKAGLTEISFKFEGDKGILIKTQDITEAQRTALYGAFYNDPKVNKDTLAFDKIGAAIGQETKNKAFYAIIFSLIAIIIYIAISFRKVSRPVKSWKYGAVTILILCHDILVPLGIMALLGRFSGREFTIPTLTALLTILGCSVNNAIVVLDRVRENLMKKSGTFREIVDISIHQTLSRSINTSLTFLFPLLSIYFLGGTGLQDFALVLIIGIIAGTYSASFLAPPFLVKWYEWSSRRG